MRHLAASALLILAAFGLLGQSSGQEGYVNPVIDELGVADPFILKWNGEYYLYTSGDPIRAFHSRDLVRWTPVGPVLESSDDPGAWNQTDVWAPEVTYRNGRFYMTYTATRASEDWRVAEAARRVGVAVSETPAGPFIDSGEPLTPGWGIDSHVFRDPDTGRDYLFYSYLYEPRLPGAGIVVDSMLDPTRVAGEPSHVTRGSEPWEDKDGDPRNGSLRYTNEAPTVVKRDGRFYMLFSGGSWDRPTYALGYAHSDEVVRGGLDGPGWTKVNPPILRSTDLVQGTGHNTVVKAPNNVDDMTAYHARVVPFPGPGARQTFLDRLYWNHDRPYLQPPSLGVLPAPDQPLFRDLFEASRDGLGSGWTVQSGSWEVRDSHAVARGRAATLINAEPLDHFVFEANLRFPGEPRGTAGVFAVAPGGDDRVDLWIDPGRSALRVEAVIDGQAVGADETPLPAGFRPDVFHQLLVTKNAGRLEVALDGVRMRTRKLGLGPVRVGLGSMAGSAAFDGVALTPHYRDPFDGPHTMDVQGGAWLVEEGALHQVAGGPELAMALKGDASESYEFTASLRWRDALSTRSTAGVVAASDGEVRITAGFDHTIWPFARFHVRHIVAAEPVGAIRVGLPRGFRYDEYHTIRVVRQGAQFTFYLDGQEMVAARFPVGPARPGVYTAGARAAFDDVAMKWHGVVLNRVLDGGFEAQPWDETPDAPPQPWTLSGGAQVVRCCAHSGVQRLVLDAPGGGARQTIDGLPPGSYVLRMWVNLRAARGQVGVENGGDRHFRAVEAGAGWQPVALEFDVAEGDTPVVSFELTSTDGGLMAVDDVHLAEREDP